MLRCARSTRPSTWLPSWGPWPSRVRDFFLLHGTITCRLGAGHFFSRRYPNPSRVTCMAASIVTNRVRFVSFYPPFVVYLVISCPYIQFLERWQRKRGRYDPTCRRRQGTVNSFVSSLNTHMVRCCPESRDLLTIVSSSWCAVLDSSHARLPCLPPRRPRQPSSSGPGWTEPQNSLPSSWPPFAAA